MLGVLVVGVLLLALLWLILSILNGGLRLILAFLSALQDRSNRPRDKSEATNP